MKIELREISIAGEVQSYRIYVDNEFYDLRYTEEGALDAFNKLIAAKQHPEVTKVIKSIEI